MNKDRRKAINEIRVNLIDLSPVEEAKSKLEELRDEEQDYYDNMPDGLKDGEKGDLARQAVENLESAISNLDTMLSEFEDCMNSLDSAAE